MDDFLNVCVIYFSIHFLIFIFKAWNVRLDRIEQMVGPSEPIYQTLPRRSFQQQRSLAPAPIETNMAALEMAPLEDDISLATLLQTVSGQQLQIPLLAKYLHEKNLIETDVLDRGVTGVSLTPVGLGVIKLFKLK